jgi:hypothetical protein
LSHVWSLLDEPTDTCSKIRSSSRRPLEILFGWPLAASRRSDTRLAAVALKLKP